MLHTVIFIGRSGSGKGTQADLFKNYINKLDSEKRQILYIETGDRFRKFIRGETYSSQLARKINEEGGRQPDFLACAIWGDMLREELEDNMHLVFDGAARSLPEAMIISTAMWFYKREQPTVIYLNVSRKWSEDRLLSRGRTDDTSLAKINKRLDWFDKDTLPVLEYFQTNNQYKFIEVNGEQTVEKVHADIISAYENNA